VVTVPGYRSGGPGFGSRALEGKKKVVGLERGPLSLVSTTEELLGRKSSGSSLEIVEYSRRDSSRWPRGTLYPQKVGTNFADKRRYSSLADWGHGVFIFMGFNTVQFGESTTFRNEVRPLSSGHKGEPSKRPVQAHLSLSTDPQSFFLVLSSRNWY
jgi:hypothetical protein